MPRSVATQNIPLHANKFSGPPGFMVKRVHELDTKPSRDNSYFKAHRDDHYIFILQEEGDSRVMIDFTLIETIGPSLLYILPGQVHHYSNTQTIKGWFMAMGASLMNDGVRAVFEGQSIAGQQICPQNTGSLCQCLQLLHDMQSHAAPDAYHLQAQLSLVNTLLAMFAGVYNSACTQQAGGLTRVSSITKEFKKMLSKHFITLKNPADYADMLNISPAYLNEAVKQSTGLPVSYWIRQQVLLEAKRLLYYTELNAKEVAHTLGYDDHAYFARFFRKNQLCTPLGFRREYRELSNHSH